MSLISELKDRVTKAPAPPDLKLMLSQTQDVLDHLQEEYGAAALGAVSDPAAQKALDGVKQKITAAKDRIELLTAALETAEKQAQDLVLAQRKTLQRSQYQTACKHLDIASGAAADYQTAIATAATAYRLMQVHQRKAEGARPLQMVWPLDALSEAEISRLAAGESYRHVSPATSGQFANADGYALVGATFSDLAFKDNPTAMAPIAETIKTRNDRVKAALKAKLIP